MLRSAITESQSHRRYLRFAAVAAFLLPMMALSYDAAAQHDHAQHSKYADFGDREIKSLSADEMESLRKGEGMGFALPAELNGYPGPRHVIDLADALELTDEQLAATRDVFDAMKKKATELGGRIIEMERHLDTAFAEKSITQEQLRTMTGHIGEARGKLRAAHLEAHLAMYDLLTEAQRRHYDMLRGYAND